MNKEVIKLSIILYILMFIISGYKKVSTFGVSEGARLAEKTGLSENLATYVVLGAGLFELLMSAMIIFGLFNKKYINYAQYGIYGLMIFTLLATIIFYVNPIKFKPLMSNLSIFTGLFLILNVCMLKNEKLF